MKIKQLLPLALLLTACVTHRYQTSIPITGDRTREQKNALAQDVVAECISPLFLDDIRSLLPPEAHPLISAVTLTITNVYPVSEPGRTLIVPTVVAKSSAELEKFKPVVNAVETLVAQQVEERLKYRPVEFRIVVASGPAGVNARFRGVKDTISVEATAFLDDRYIASATGAVGLISMKLTPAGRLRVNNASARNVGRQLAVIINGVVVTVPRIEAAIDSEIVEIAGNYTQPEAETVAGMLGGSK